MSISNFHLQKLRNLVAEKVPDLNVHTAVYPKYDTRGDLAVCVEAFKEWHVISRIQVRLRGMELTAFPGFKVKSQTWRPMPRHRWRFTTHRSALSWLPILLGK